MFAAIAALHPKLWHFGNAIDDAVVDYRRAD
jgi:hypothetical protein